jgi:hypothetical protein
MIQKRVWNYQLHGPVESLELQGYMIQKRVWNYQLHGPVESLELQGYMIQKRVWNYQLHGGLVESWSYEITWPQRGSGDMSNVVTLKV